MTRIRSNPNKSTGNSRKAGFDEIGYDMPRLILNREGVDLVMHEVVRDIVMIGRAPSNHIVIYHPTVSAQHAVLLRVGVSYWLMD